MHGVLDRLRWSRPITDSSHPGPPDAREVLGLEAAIRYLISQADTDDLPVPDHEPDRSRWWRDLRGDMGVGDYFNAERRGQGHLYARRVSDRP